ncbi:hypothetical protein ACOSQ3_033138 [Xanthoceras sorbifolium]
MRRSHTLNVMQNKLKQKWPLIGQWQLTDQEDGYFVARFEMKEDLEMALIGGPWVIANQYQVVQHWRLNFVPREEQIRNIAIWVRLMGLPIECMDLELLWRIGGMLGTICKVDPVTESQARGRFARLCVEIDIFIPIMGTLYVRGRAIRVEYENLGLSCFNCGRYWHIKESYREGLKTKGNMDINGKKANESINKSNPYAPWLFVSYNKNGNRPARRPNGFNGNLGNNDNIGNSEIYDGRSSRGNKNFWDMDKDSLHAEKGKATDKNGEGLRGIGRGGLGHISGERISSPGKTVKSTADKFGGSRFEVLLDEENKDYGANTRSGTDLKHKEVLAEISNTVQRTMKPRGHAKKKSNPPYDTQRVKE